jgi:hypothetical protein
LPDPLALMLAPDEIADDLTAAAERCTPAAAACPLALAAPPALAMLDCE